MTLELPKPIAAYFTADKADSEAVSQCFTEDAVVKDEGHTHKGHAAVNTQYKTLRHGPGKLCRNFAVATTDIQQGLMAVKFKSLDQLPGPAKLSLGVDRVIFRVPFHNDMPGPFGLFMLQEF